MIDYEISRCTRRCFRSGRELRPGEVVYSLLISEGESIVRRDCSLEAWQGPPDEAVGWWKTQLPKPDHAAPKMASPLIIAQRFDQLVANEADPQLLTVMALLMVRKRILKEDDASLERKGAVWRLHCGLTEQTYEIPRVAVDPRRVQSLQEVLLELLYGDEELSLESLLQANAERGSSEVLPKPESQDIEIDGSEIDGSEIDVTVSEAIAPSDSGRAKRATDEE